MMKTMEELYDDGDVYCVLDGNNGCDIPALFCGMYRSELIEAGFGADLGCVLAYVKMDTGITAEDKLARLFERANDAFDNILDNFTCRGYGFVWNQNLYAVREGVELSDEFWY